MENSENIVIFHLVSSLVKTNANGSHRADVVLEASIKDLNLYDSIVEGLDNLIIDQCDFKQEVINILNRKARELETKAQTATLTAADTVAKSKHRIAILESDLLVATKRIKLLEHYLAECAQRERELADSLA